MGGSFEFSYVNTGRAIPHSKGLYTYTVLVKTVLNYCHPNVQGTPKIFRLKDLYYFHTLHRMVINCLFQSYSQRSLKENIGIGYGQVSRLPKVCYFGNLLKVEQLPKALVHYPKYKPMSCCTS